MTMTDTASQIAHDDLVGEVMASHPATIRIFLSFGMRCVGCPIAWFDTVDDACSEHRVDRAIFLDALRRAAEANEA